MSRWSKRSTASRKACGMRFLSCAGFSSSPTCATDRASEQLLLRARSTRRDELSEIELDARAIQSQPRHLLREALVQQLCPDALAFHACPPARVVVLAAAHLADAR